MSGTDPAAAPDPADPAAAPPRPRRRLDPLVPVLAVVGAGVVLAALHHAHLGVWLVAAGLALAAGLRLVLRPAAAGLLVVRSRHADVATLLALAGGVGLLAAVTPFPAGAG